jgi:glucoselysine-6-phosphate deglycase
MKSIKDYVNLEQDFYSNILKNKDELYGNQFNEKVLKGISNIVIFATGSSSNAAYSALPFMSKVTGLPIYIEEPSIAANYLLNFNNDTLYFAITQGGHSYSIINLVEKFEKNGKKIFTLTSDASSPAYKVSDNVLSMGMPIEEMPYVSAGYSVTILDLMLISMRIGKILGNLSDRDEKDTLADIDGIIAKMSNIVDRSNKWINDNISTFKDAKRLVWIGYGSTYGVSREGETKITETVGISSWGKELEEYMHGPYLGLQENDLIIFIDPNGTLEDRVENLYKFLKLHVNDVFIINSVNKKHEKDLDLNVTCNELLASLYMTIPVHLLSFELSQCKGNDLEKSAYPEFDKITASKI